MTLFDKVSYPLKYHSNIYQASLFSCSIHYSTTLLVVYLHWYGWFWLSHFHEKKCRYSPVWKFGNWAPICASISDVITFSLFCTTHVIIHFVMASHLDIFLDFPFLVLSWKPYPPLLSLLVLTYGVSLYIYSCMSLHL